MALVCIAVLLFNSTGASQELSLQRFSAADGLAQDYVNKIVRDSRGFLWFCTGDGLSRFDGSRFKNYSQEEGLPHRNVNDLLETRSGEYLIATGNGIAVFDPHGKPVRWNVVEGKLEDTGNEPPLFRTYLPTDSSSMASWGAMNALAEHGDGYVYAATNHNLYRFLGNADDRRYEPIEFEGWRNRDITFNSLREDGRGGLWIATSIGIYRMDGDGGIETIADIGGNSIFEDRDGSVWVDCGGHDLGIRRYKFADGRIILDEVFTTKNGLQRNAFSNAIAHEASGRLLVQSAGVVFEYIPATPPASIAKFVRLHDGPVASATIEPSGDVWFASLGKGALKLPASDFKVFAADPGLGTTGSISSIYFDRTGRVNFTTDDNRLLVTTDERLLKMVPLRLAPRSWGETFLDVQTPDGEWWFPTSAGLYRYPSVPDRDELGRVSPKKIYGISDGLPSAAIFVLFADSKNNLWFTVGRTNSLFKFDRRTERIVELKDLPGTTERNGAVVSFAEDRAGNLWFGYFLGGLGRLRDDGEFQLFGSESGIPESFITDIHTDRSGRLWVATRSRGLFRVDEPDALVPAFKNISTREGLSSNETNCLAEDRFGVIYAGTGRGLQRLDPRAGSLKLYTEKNGLPGNYVLRCRESPGGDIWFVASGVVTKLEPAENVSSPAPATYIEAFVVNGNSRKISELGETSLDGVELDAGENRIEIGYFALGLGSGETPRYQYRLGDGEWTATQAASVTFDLAPGSYAFEVRTLASDGSVTDNGATASFWIAPPIWQRSWFLVLAFLFAGGAIFALDRYRVSKTRQVERALSRTRESESRFRTLADTASDAIVTIDEGSTIVFVNQAVERVFGYTPAEIVGKKLTMLMPERRRDGHEAGIERYLRTSSRNIEWAGVTLPGLHKDGREIPLELSFGEFVRDGKKFFTGIARDITERLRAEEDLRNAREERMNELQKVRSRIATDLHDDIGSSLTQIAVLSEVARGQASHSNADGVTTPLERIKNVSRELVSVMSDIVWAINPQKDYLKDLVQRMRRFASDILSGRGVSFEFDAPEVDESIELGANVRREIFAIFKESINNAVKYSECTKVATSFIVSNDSLTLRVSDDGKGFDTEFVLSEIFKPEMGGNGLASMKRRASELGGVCDIRSVIGEGTEINVTVPIGPRESG